MTALENDRKIVSINGSLRGASTTAEGRRKNSSFFESLIPSD